jgi:flagellar basal-body rod protein FlgG
MISNRSAVVGRRRRSQTGFAGCRGWFKPAVPVAAVLAILGLLAGQLVLWRSIPREPASDLLMTDMERHPFDAPGAVRNSPGRQLAGSRFGQSTDDGASDSSVEYFPDALSTGARGSDAEEGVAYLLADGRVHPGHGVAGSSPPTLLKPKHAHPDELSPPSNATPLAPRDDGGDETSRAIIAQELPRATVEEREIWFEELRDLDANTIREILQLRRRIGGRGRLPALLQAPAGEDAAASAPATRPAEPLQPECFHLVESALRQSMQPTIAALNEARRVILHNLSNANTIGFKRSRVLLGDVPCSPTSLSGLSDATQPPASAHVGARVQAVQVDQSHGPLRKTGRPLDLAIVGEGFFQIRNGDEIVYTRAGVFARNERGELALVGAERRWLLEPAITILHDAEKIVISADGHVSVRRPGETSLTEVGQIRLAKFINPSGLASRGSCYFAATDTSGQPEVSVPGSGGFGKLRQRYVERSNVALEKELELYEAFTVQLRAIERVLAVETEQSMHVGDVP